MVDQGCAITRGNASADLVPHVTQAAQFQLHSGKDGSTFERPSGGLRRHSEDRRNHMRPLQLSEYFLSQPERSLPKVT